MIGTMTGEIFAIIINDNSCMCNLRIVTYVSLNYLFGNVFVNIYIYFNIYILIYIYLYIV